MRQVLNIANYEMRHILKSPFLIAIVFIAPLGYAALFGTTYVSAILSNIPLAIVDQDGSELSREIVTAYRNSPYFAIVEDINTYEELEEGMKRGIVRAGVVIPNNFSTDVRQHRKTEVLTVYDGSNQIWSLNIRRYAYEIVNQFSAQYTASYLGGMGFSKKEINNTMNTVDCNISVWYNSTFNYENYLFPGLLLMIIHQLSLLGTALTVTREKEQNSWIQYLASSISAWKIVLGKSLPYLMASFFNYALLFWIAVRFINVKLEADIAVFAFLGLFYCITVVFAGFFISLHSPNSLQVTRYIILLSIPFIMISGYTWPARYIPDFLNAIARVLPTTWMMEGIRMAGIKSLGIEHTGLNMMVLALMAVLALGLALTFKKDRKAPEDKGVLVNGGSSYPRKI